MLQAILKSKFRATGSGNRQKRWMRVAGMIASKEKLRRTSCNGNVPVNTTVSARHIQRPSHPCSKPLLAVLFLRQGAVLYQSHPSLRPTLRHKSGRRSKRMTHADTRLLQRLGPDWLLTRTAASEAAASHGDRENRSSECLTVRATCRPCASSVTLLHGCRVMCRGAAVAW